MVSICWMSRIASVVRPDRLIIVVLGRLFYRISCVFADRSNNSGVAGGVALTTSGILAFALFLVTDLNVCEMILIITVDRSSDAIPSHTGCKRLLLSLRDATLISINELVLGCVMRIVVEGIATDLDFSSINIDLLAFLSMRSAAPFLGLLSFGLLLHRLLIFKDTSARENAQLKGILHDTIHRSFGKFPTRYALSDSGCVEVIETHAFISLFDLLRLLGGN